MIRHIVMFKFLPSANGKSKEENLLEAKRRMMSLKDIIPQIINMEVLLAAPGSAESNYDYILVSDFNNLEELAVYQKHPAHVEFGNFVRELREPDGRACIDYEI